MADKYQNTKSINSRSERREINKRKWISKLKKLHQSHYLWIINPVKSRGKRTGYIHGVLNYISEHPITSWTEYMTDRTGVLYKNTGTIYNHRKHSDQDIHKMRLKNRSLSPEDIEEINDYLETA